jgi:predicted O-methyltransferase YrrM
LETQNKKEKNMSVITSNDFHQIYGPGRPPCAGSPNYTPEKDIRVITALADHFRVKRCLEIGCNIGATAMAILQKNDIIREYVGVDLPEIWFNEAKAAAGYLALEDKRFRLLQLENGARDIKPGDIEPCDFIFIDGAHDYNSVKADTELAHSLLAPGGIVVWHDYQHPKNPDVAKLIHEINDKPGVPPIVWVKGTWTAYKITAAPDAAQPEEKSDEPAEQPAEPKKRKRRTEQPDAGTASPVA